MRIDLDLSEPDHEKQYREKCEAILSWADDHPGRFDTSFIESLVEQERPLSGGQQAAIDRIIDAFHIEY